MIVVINDYITVLAIISFGFNVKNFTSLANCLHGLTARIDLDLLAGNRITFRNDNSIAAIRVSCQIVIICNKSSQAVTISIVHFTKSINDINKLIGEISHSCRCLNSHCGIHIILELKTRFLITDFPLNNKLVSKSMKQFGFILFPESERVCQILRTLATILSHVLHNQITVFQRQIFINTHVEHLLQFIGYKGSPPYCREPTLFEI